jgi:hypothetical protein
MLVTLARLYWQNDKDEASRDPALLQAIDNAILALAPEAPGPTADMSAAP